MSIAIFLAYMDYCKSVNKTPSVAELITWKLKYDKR